VLVQFKGNQDPKQRIHVPAPAGIAMVASGTFEEYIDYTKVIANSAPRVRWTVTRDDSGRPMIHAQCARCAEHGQQGNQYFSSGRGTAHEMVFTCFHWSETAPADVARVYLDEWKKWTRTAAQPATARPKFYATR
jgi:hypothetical protein